jgi:hypothetical protein
MEVLKSSQIFMAPTHGECRVVAGAVRKAMKDKGLLSDSEHPVTRLQRLNLTESQERDAVTYEPGQTVEFHKIAKGASRAGVQEKRFKSGEQWKVLRREEGGVIVGKDGIEKQLPLDQTKKFSVFEREEITLAIGDRIRFTKNVKHRGQKFLNNELRTVVNIGDRKIIFDKGEIARKGAALHLDQGIAVTSHASQSKTVDQVIASMPFGRSARRTRHNFMSRCRVQISTRQFSRITREHLTHESQKRECQKFETIR